LSCFSYRISNDGKFPSVNLTHKEVGGSYYIVREIVRDVIQENRVLGPGGLDATALSFEDCPDSSEVYMKHELVQDNIESLEMSDNGQVGKGSVLESFSSDESFSLQNNSISTEILLGSSNILEAGVLKSVVQNGSAAGAALLETNVEKQDEVPSGGPIEVSLNGSEEQDPSFAHVSDSDKNIGLNSQADAHEGVGSVATDRVILSSESTAVYETNGALLREHGTLPNDNHDGSNDSVLDDANVLAATNVLQEKQASFHEHVPSNESVPVDDVQSLDGQSGTTVSSNSINGFNSEAEVTTKTIEASNERSLQAELDQPLLDAFCDQQENGGSPVSHPALDTKGLMHTEVQHSVVETVASQFKKSTSGVTKEEVEATDASHEQGMSTTTAISRRTSKAQQKKDDNLFWLVIRAFVVAISKIWAK